MLKKEGGLIAPDFACMGGENWNAANMTRFEKDRFSYRNTAVDVSAIRRQFQLDSWEYSLPKSPYFNVDWEYENLVSAIPMRHPIDRFLAGGKCGKFHSSIHSDPNPGNQGEYWEYANSKCAYNYALRILGTEDGTGKCSRTPMPDECLESAKELIRRFTFVLDQSCLTESVDAMAKVLGIGMQPELRKQQHKPRSVTSAFERIGNATLYNYVAERFRADIELYEWSKSLSIVDCSKLKT